MKVIPHHPTTVGVQLFIRAGFNERRWSVEVRDHDSSRVAHRWRASPSVDHLLPNVIPGLPAYSVWREDVSDLSPGAEYDVYIIPTFRNERLVAQFSTIPTQLPLRILTGSCYYADGDTAATNTLPLQLATSFRLGRFASLTRKLRTATRAVLSVFPRRGSPSRLQGGVARRYRRLYDDKSLRPHVKILLGDQVYLDAPVREFLKRHESPSKLRGRVARNYQKSWELLGEFLTLGANVCVSDDHEFWNDYPNDPAFPWRSLQGDGPRAAFKEAASDHLCWMQLAQPTSHLSVQQPRCAPALEVFVADTRIHRTPSSSTNPRFMSDADLDLLVRWVEDLRCPGALFLGQPVLVSRAGPFDDNLRSFEEQYSKLCQALAAATHDIVIVGGDVHFGRVAEIVFPGTGHRHVEVVSSPLSVLDGAEASISTNLASELEVFPPGTSRDDPAGTTRWVNGVPGRGRDALCEDHAMLLQFDPNGNHVKLTVTAYFMRRVDSTGMPLSAWSEEFELE